MSRNAVTHGIHSSVLVLRSENEPEYRRIEAEHLALWNPEATLERLLVDQIIAAEWRLCRTWVAPELKKELGAFDEFLRAAARLAARLEKRLRKSGQTLARQQHAQILQNETQPEKAA